MLVFGGVGYKLCRGAVDVMKVEACFFFKSLGRVVVKVELEEVMRHDLQ